MKTHMLDARLEIRDKNVAENKNDASDYLFPSFSFFISFLFVFDELNRVYMLEHIPKCIERKEKKRNETHKGR